MRSGISLKEIAEASLRKMMWDNAAELYGLS